MRVLLDSCVWGGAREVIAVAGHDVQWVGDWEGDPGGQRDPPGSEGLGCREDAGL